MEVRVSPELVIRSSTRRSCSHGFPCGIALMCKFLEFYEERHKIMEGYSRSLEELCMKRGRIIELYEKLYGQLPQEEKNK